MRLGNLYTENLRYMEMAGRVTQLGVGALVCIQGFGKVYFSFRRVSLA